MNQKQNVQKVYSKRALKITLKTVLNSSIKERKVLSSKRILNFRTLVATEVWRPVSLYSNALQNDRPSPRTFLKTTARNSPSLQSVSSDGRIMCATKTESLNNVSTLCEDIILYTSTTRGIYPVANWHALCSPVEPNNNTHGTLNYSWHWKQNPQWPPEKKGTVGATQVLVLFLPVFTDFENDVVLTDAITTKAKPGMRKVGWGLAGFLASLRKSAFYVKIYHFSCCLKAYTLAFQRALENFNPVLTTVK